MRRVALVFGFEMKGVYDQLVAGGERNSVDNFQTYLPAQSN